MIEAYTFGKIVIDGKAYTNDVIIYKGKITSWWRKTSHNVEPDDIEKYLEQKPEIVVIGTGESGVMEVPEETRQFIEQKGIKLIIQKTGEAVKTFNDLKGNKMGMFHLTC